MDYCSVIRAHAAPGTPMWQDCPNSKLLLHSHAIFDKQLSGAD
jgi:hypothetical protein